MKYLRQKQLYWLKQIRIKSVAGGKSGRRKRDPENANYRKFCVRLWPGGNIPVINWQLTSNEYSERMCASWIICVTKFTSECSHSLPVYQKPKAQRHEIQSSPN